MKKLIAFCGLDCEKCDARTATINNDDEMREKVAKLWTELNGVEIAAKMINCEGCRIDGVKTPFCDKLCPIRQCAISKTYDTCGNCTEVEMCQTVGMVISNNVEALDNLKNK